MVNVTSPPPPAAPKFTILSYSFPSSVQVNARGAVLSATIRNDGNGTGDCQGWITNMASSPGSVEVYDATYGNLIATLAPGTVMSPYVISYSVAPGEVRDMPLVFELVFKSVGSYSLKFSVGHDGVEDSVVSFGCPEGEEAQREAERYASA
jgi:hypothetical protein